MSMRREFLLVLVIATVLAGCNSAGNENGDSTPDETVSSLKFYVKEGSPEFNDAELTMNSPYGEISMGDKEVLFSYELMNYDLGAQTEGSDHCANSADGQHIHLILNNAPYLARYETEFDEKMEEGHYVALSFLSRSYHESIKNGKAYDLRQFTVGEVEPNIIDLSTPHMFYSRPKGTYSGHDAEHVLLDFYLVNCDLSNDGYYAVATINGQDFRIETWAPHVMEGLPLGENTIRLELFDSNGNSVDSPFNPVERTVNLAEAG